MGLEDARPCMLYCVPRIKKRTVALADVTRRHGEQCCANPRTPEFLLSYRSWKWSGVQSVAGTRALRIPQREMICCTSALSWAEARDLLISMSSSEFRRGRGAGQGRNTTVVVGKAFYLAKPTVMRRQLGPVESHFRACAILTIGYCTDKTVFSTRERRKASSTLLTLLAKSM